MYRDVGTSPDLAIYYPEHVATFAASGFEWVGSLLPVGHDEESKESKESIASLFAGQDRNELLESFEVATPVLRSPEYQAFVEISKWCGAPMFRFWTLLTDGSIACTMTPIERLPMLAHPNPFVVQLPADEELLRSSIPARGRSTRMAAASAPLLAWHEHREHTTEYAASRGAEPARHEHISLSLQIAEQSDEHSAQCQQTGFRYIFAGIVLFGFLGMVLAMMLMFALSSRTGGASALPGIVAATLVPPVGILGVRYLMKNIFRWRRIRPAFNFRPA